MCFGCRTSHVNKFHPQPPLPVLSKGCLLGRDTHNLFFLEKFAHINRALPQFKGNFSEKGMCQHRCSGALHVFVNNVPQIMCFVLGSTASGDSKAVW